MKPKIRLKGFEEEWEKKPLRDLCYKEASSISKDSLGTSEGQYPIFGASGYIQNIDYYQQENIYVGIVKDGAGVGRANVYPAKSSLLGTMQYILPKANTDVDFLGYLLNKTDLSIYNTGSTIPHIYFKDYGEQMVLAPGFPEQQSIATYFKSLDALIQATTKKVTQLKQLKAASLISMFPQDGETKPKVRFKGFEGEWEDVSFKDITYLSGIRNKENLQLESYSISNENGFVPQNEQFEHGGSMSQADKRLYYIVSPDSFAYNPARINIGSIGYDDLSKDVIVSSLYVVFKTDDETYNPFLNYWFKTTAFKKMIELYQEGGVRLYFFYDKLCSCHFRRPSFAEQQYIASYFQNLDTQIHLQEQRLEKLKQIKTACLEQMFV